MKTRTCLSLTLLLICFLEIITASSVDAVIRIMPLGDSITRGSSSGVSDPDYQVSYRKALWDLLFANGYEVDYVGSLNNGSAVFGSLELADHEGHAGWTDDAIVSGLPGYGSLEDWLIEEHPNIVLLHIGTNRIDASPDDVKDILDVIDNHEINFGEAVWVILARIINRNIYSQTTTEFNDNVEILALDRINNPNNPAYPDKIILVDMENGANINYDLATNDPPGDMWNDLHPFETGYEKMADVWFYGLQEILPVANAGSDQNVVEGNMVTLNASHSFDPDGMIVSYLWEQQPDRPLVTLSDLGAVKPTFTAPDVELSGETLTFKVTVTDADGLESTDITNINVSNDNCPSDPNKTKPGSCGCGVSDIDTDGDGTSDCIDTDDDNDSLLDKEEQGPDGNDTSYDGNIDGIADSLQDNVGSLHTYDYQNYITIEVPAEISIRNCKAADNPSSTNAPSDIEFVYLFFEFSLEDFDIGGATTVSLYFPDGITFDTYYVFGPTPNNPAKHWYEFLYDGQTGAQINGKIITLHLVDSKKGDDDLTANGIVMEVGAPAVANKSSAATNSGGSSGSIGCFIATAAHESLMEPYVKILSNFGNLFMVIDTKINGFYFLLLCLLVYHNRLRRKI